MAKDSSQSNLTVQNWKKDITYHPDKFEVIHSVEDIQRIVRDKESYPTPVRVKGSHHSTTRCIVADEGTVCDLSKFNKILNVDVAGLTITAQAGVIQIDAAKELEKAGLQFYINLEIGNMTLGSGATGSTKDASYYDNGAWEFGQFGSYCIAMKAVSADGSIISVTETENPELMAAMRTSYGLLGIVYEVTFRVKKISAMAVRHESYSVNEFANRLDELLDRKKSMMLYLYPFNDRVVVEYRYDSAKKLREGSLTWAFRNYTWKSVWPFIANALTFLPIPFLRNRIHGLLNSLTGLVQTKLLRDDRSSPADQIIRYSESAGFASYTFSIWGFKKEVYSQAIREYFAFCKEYARRTGYRCELLNVGYHIAQDRSSLFSYSRNSSVLTLDPVATGRGKWKEFIQEYNAFCAARNAVPLLNQTPGLTPAQVQNAFREEIIEFNAIRAEMDPAKRFLNEYFSRVFGITN